MKRNLFFLMLILLGCFSVFAVEDGVLNYYLDDVYFKDILADELNILKENNFTTTRFFDTENYEIRVYFSNSDDIDDLFTTSEGVYGVVKKSSKIGINYELAINFESIYNSVNNSENYSEVVDSIENTLFHELAHIQMYKLLDNFENNNLSFRTNLNLNITQNDGDFYLNNSDYFENIEEFKILSLPNDKIRNSVRFSNVYSSYDSPDWAEETFVRILSACLQENTPSQFKSFEMTTIRNNSFCNDFNVLGYQNNFESYFRDLATGYLTNIYGVNVELVQTIDDSFDIIDYIIEKSTDLWFLLASLIIVTQFLLFILLILSVLKINIFKSLGNSNNRNK